MFLHYIFHVFPNTGNEIERSVLTPLPNCPSNKNTSNNKQGNCSKLLLVYDCFHFEKFFVGSKTPTFKAVLKSIAAEEQKRFPNNQTLKYAGNIKKSIIYLFITQMKINYCFFFAEPQVTLGVQQGQVLDTSAQPQILLQQVSS